MPLELSHVLEIVALVKHVVVEVAAWRDLARDSAGAAGQVEHKQASPGAAAQTETQ